MSSLGRGLSGGAISGFGLLRSAASPLCLLCRFRPCGRVRGINEDSSSERALKCSRVACSRGAHGLFERSADGSFERGSDGSFERSFECTRIVRSRGAWMARSRGALSVRGAAGPPSSNAARRTSESVDNGVGDECSADCLRRLTCPYLPLLEVLVSCSR